MTDGDSDRISVQDAVRLKHEINQSIKYGGYNAQQLEELSRLDEKQRTDLNAELLNIRKVWWFLPDWTMAVGFLAACGLFFYVPGYGARLACIAAMLYCAWQLAYRMGVYYGFMRGYQEGNTSGVKRVLGISDADAADARERAIEMQIDDGVVRRLDEQKNQTAPR